MPLPVLLSIIFQIVTISAGSYSTQYTNPHGSIPHPVPYAPDPEALQTCTFPGRPSSDARTGLGRFCCIPALRQAPCTCTAQVPHRSRAKCTPPLPYFTIPSPKLTKPPQQSPDCSNYFQYRIFPDKKQVTILWYFRMFYGFLRRGGEKRDFVPWGRQRGE